MSEAAPEGGNTSGETPAADEFTPITSQDDLNRVIGERIKRVESKFADYGDLQAKAAKLAEIEAANQTEAQRAEARAAELESELKKVRGESMRLRIATEHGITDADDIALFLTGTDEETLTKQAKRLADREADRKKNGNRVPREGQTSSSPGDGGEREFARALFDG
jgi:hypothetical protein